MKQPQLLRHGEHIKREYQVPEGVNGPDWADKSTDDERSDGNKLGIVQRYKKQVSASDTPFNIGMIRAVYPHAIRYGYRVFEGADPRGASVLAAATMVIIAWFMIQGTLIPDYYYYESQGWETSSLITYGVIAILMSLFFIILSIKQEFFKLADEPVIFDRKRRKVYWHFGEKPHGFFGFFKKAQAVTCEYDWDLIDAEHHAVMHADNNMVNRSHHLIFLVRRSADDPTIIDSFTIGGGILMNEQTTPMIWEHIRRFMEENGPHLPKGDPMPKKLKEKGILGRLKELTPFSVANRQAWRQHTFGMLVMHIFFPLMLPLHFFWYLGAGMVEKSAIPVRWPQEVLDYIGPELTAQQLGKEERD